MVDWRGFHKTPKVNISPIPYHWHQFQRVVVCYWPEECAKKASRRNPRLGLATPWDEESSSMQMRIVSYCYWVRDRIQPWDILSIAVAISCPFCPDWDWETYSRRIRRTVCFEGEVPTAACNSRIFIFGFSVTSLWRRSLCSRDRAGGRPLRGLEAWSSRSFSLRIV